MSVTILIGDVRNQLRTLAADSVDCVVTSPPYWGLRDYGVAGQIGMEPTLGEHLGVMVDVFREVRRVVKADAPVWVNYGDCYASTPNGRSAADTKAAGNDDRTFRDKPFSTVGGVLKPKDLCLIPARLAIALQEDGWWVRSRAIWGKPNAMPDSSGRYRPAVAHEEIYLLSKSGNLYYDFEAVKKPALSTARPPVSGWANEGEHSTIAHNCGQRRDKQRGHSRRHAGFNDRWYGMSREEQQAGGRLLRTYEPEVWEIPCASFGESHFATFPPALVQRCLTAGCRPGGMVLDPFGGAGTTGMVAEAMGFDSVLIELNPDYAAIADNRIRAALGRVTGAPLKKPSDIPLLALMEG